VPHVASATPATRIAMGEIVVANIRAVLNGQPPQTCVNPEVLKS
jgi:glyoxylate reductase